MSYDKYGKLEHINPETLTPAERLAFEAWINTSYVTGFTAYKEAFFAGKSCPDAKPLIEALEKIRDFEDLTVSRGSIIVQLKSIAAEALKNYNP